MATKKAVAIALGKLGRNFAGEVDDERIRIYHEALTDIEDGALLLAVDRVISTHEGAFIPPVAVLRRVAGANTAPAIDSAALIRQIEKLAVYNPSCGMMYPHVSQVRDRLGDAIGAAYAAAGGQRLFSENETTRSISEREFQTAMREAVSSGHAAAIVGADIPKQLAP